MKNGLFLKRNASSKYIGTMLKGVRQNRYYEYDDDSSVKPSE